MHDAVLCCAVPQANCKATALERAKHDRHEKLYVEEFLEREAQRNTEAVESMVQA